jgi:hypothetical protein
MGCNVRLRVGRNLISRWTSDKLGISELLLGSISHMYIPSEVKQNGCPLEGTPLKMFQKHRIVILITQSHESAVKLRYWNPGI